MENKGRKMLALIAVIGLCAVALIGAAYAAFAGTASTYNENNAANTSYMTVTPGSTTSADWTAISVSTNTAEFSTYTYEHTTTGENPTTTTENAYYYTGGTTISQSGSVANGYYVKDLVSTAKSFEIDNQTGADITSINLTITAKVGENGNIGTTADFKYFLKVTGSTTEYYEVSTTAATKAISINITDGQKGSFTVGLCIGYIVDCYIPADGIGDVKSTSQTGYTQAANNAATAPVDMDKVSFGFVVGIPA